MEDGGQRDFPGGGWHQDCCLRFGDAGEAITIDKTTEGQTEEGADDGTAADEARESALVS